MGDQTFLIRPTAPADREAWAPLWNGYNAFYGREGATALALAITQTTWQRFFDPAEPVFALVAESRGRLLGLAHYLYHRSTTRLEPTYSSSMPTMSDGSADASQIVTLPATCAGP